MLKKFIPKFLKKKIVTNKYFWKLRHFISLDAWSGYANDWNISRRKFYSDFVFNYKINSILDFGCATGVNLVRIENDYPKKQFCFLGIDISSKAIEIAKKKVKSRSCFYNYLDKSNLLSFLKNNGLKAFDLVIFDRVLYLLNENEINILFNNYKIYFKYIILDDFHSELKATNGVYTSKNYVKIFEKNGYKLIQISESEHKIMDVFFKNHAKRMVFVNEIHN